MPFVEKKETGRIMCSALDLFIWTAHLGDLFRIHLPCAVPGDSNLQGDSSESPMCCVQTGGN